MDETGWMRDHLTRELLKLSVILTEKAKLVASSRPGEFFSDFVRPDFLEQEIRNLVGLGELCLYIHNRWTKPILFRKFGPISGGDK